MEQDICIRPGSILLEAVKLGMRVDRHTLQTLLDSELASVSDTRIVSHIRRLLVDRDVMLRTWDYGEPNQQ